MQAPIVQMSSSPPGDIVPIPLQPAQAALPTGSAAVPANMLQPDGSPDLSGQILGLGVSVLVPLTAALICTLLAICACCARLIYICTSAGGGKRRRKKSKGITPSGYTGDVKGALMAANPDDANLAYYDEEGPHSPSVNTQPRRGGHQYLGHIVGEALAREDQFFLQAPVPDLVNAFKCALQCSPPLHQSAF